MRPLQHALPALPRPPSAHGGGAIVVIPPPLIVAAIAAAENHDRVAVVARHIGVLQKGKSAQTRVGTGHLVAAAEDDGVAGGTKEETVEEAIGTDHGSGEAHIRKRYVGSGHCGDAAQRQRKRAEDIDDRIDKKCRVVRQLKRGSPFIGAGAISG